MSYDEEEDSSTLIGVIIEQKLIEFMKQLTPQLEEIRNNIAEESNRAKENAVRETGFTISQFQQQLKNLEDENKSQKNEIEVLKTGMTEKQEKIEQLEQSFAKITEEVSISIKESLDALSSRVNSGFGKYDQSLAEHAEELSKIGNSLESVSNELQNFSSDFKNSINEHDQALAGNGERMDKLAKGIELLGSQMAKWQQDTDTKLGETNNKLTSSVEKLSSTIEEVFTGLNQELENDRKNNAEKLEQLVNNVNDRLQKAVDLIQGLKEENTSDHKRFDDSINRHDNSLSQLDDVLNLIKQFIKTLREETLNSFEEVKSDQKDLMQRFQRIVLGTAETLRNENVIIAKEVRGQLDTISKEFERGYYSVEAGTKLEERTKSLGEELRENSDKVRDQLVENIEDAINKFQEATKEALASVDEVKLDIESYKDEILSLIERKVNEKYDFISDIMGNLLTKSEQLKIMVRDSKLKVPDTTISTEKS
ncbi:MAG: hypothetical protein ACFFD4_29355 [Candidatus Odinarchaeota archaeon]